MQWNCDWEYENQGTLKAWYVEQLISGELDGPVRRIICKGCGRVFYTQIPTKKYCYYYRCGNRGYQKELKQRRLEKRKDMVCKCCGRTFTPKRIDAAYCSNACRQKAYRMRGTDSSGVQSGHLPQP